MPLQQAIACRIRDLRKDHYLKFNKLAFRAGIPVSTFYRIINGRMENLEMDLVFKLCCALNIALVDFFNNEIFDNLEQKVQ